MLFCVGFLLIDNESSKDQQDVISAAIRLSLNMSLWQWACCASLRHATRCVGARIMRTLCRSCCSAHWHGYGWQSLTMDTHRCVHYWTPRVRPNVCWHLLPTTTTTATLRQDRLATGPCGPCVRAEKLVSVLTARMLNSCTPSGMCSLCSQIVSSDIWLTSIFHRMRKIYCLGISHIF